MPANLFHGFTSLKDVGAGLGHLSRLLSYGYKLRVVTIEGDGCHQSGAEKIDEKVLTHLNKVVL